MAAVVDDGFLLDPHPPPVLLKMYKYINRSLTFESILGTCKGQIHFQSPHGASDWHGEVSFNDETKTMGLLFNCLGGDQPLRSLLVAELADGAWEGVDYWGRSVRMELIAEYELDENEKWRPVPS